MAAGLAMLVLRSKKKKSSEKLRFSHHHISMSNHIPTENSTDLERAPGAELRTDVSFGFCAGIWSVIKLKSNLCLKQLAKSPQITGARVSVCEHGDSHHDFSQKPSRYKTKNGLKLGPVRVTVTGTKTFLSQTLHNRSE